MTEDELNQAADELIAQRMKTTATEMMMKRFISDVSDEIKTYALLGAVVAGLARDLDQREGVDAEGLFGMGFKSLLPRNLSQRERKRVIDGMIRRFIDKIYATAGVERPGVPS